MTDVRPGPGEHLDRHETDEERGRDDGSPTQITKPGWKDVLKRVTVEIREDRLALLAAGVAFFTLLALVPAMAAGAALYGLLADPSQLQRHINDLLGAAPREVRELVSSQLSGIVQQSSGKTAVAFVLSLVLALWSASSGMQHLIEAINAAYDEKEDRTFVKLRGLSLLMTLGAFLFATLALAMVAILPVALSKAHLGGGGRIAANVLRWPLLGVLLVVGLAVVYRYAPSRREPEWSWVSPGAVVATVLWLIGSAVFSVYTANFAHYNQTYGALGAVVVVMLWLMLTAFVVILGAELNAGAERQTRADSTAGPSDELGERDAYAADAVGASARAADD